MSKIIQAMQVANKAHSGQIRKNTHEPYIFHPTRVALFVGCLKTCTEEMVIAAWLHDVLEDSNITKDQIEILFGTNVLNLVVELTNVYTKENFPSLNRKERHKLEHERLSKISDEGKIIKLADRMDNIYSYGENIPKFYKEETIELVSKIGDAFPEISSTILDLLEI